MCMVFYCLCSLSLCPEEHERILCLFALNYTVMGCCWLWSYNRQHHCVSMDLWKIPGILETDSSMIPQWYEVQWFNLRPLIFCRNNLHMDILVASLCCFYFVLNSFFAGLFFAEQKTGMPTACFINVEPNKLYPAHNSVKDITACSFRPFLPIICFSALSPR